MGSRYWRKHGNRERTDKLVKPKKSLIPCGAKVPRWKTNLCCKCLQVSLLPWWREISGWPDWPGRQGQRSLCLCFTSVNARGNDLLAFSRITNVAHCVLWQSVNSSSCIIEGLSCWLICWAQSNPAFFLFFCCFFSTLSILVCLFVCLFFLLFLIM